MLVEVGSGVDLGNNGFQKGGQRLAVVVSVAGDCAL